MNPTLWLLLLVNVAQGVALDGAAIVFQSYAAARQEAVAVWELRGGANLSSSPIPAVPPRSTVEAGSGLVALDRNSGTAYVAVTEELLFVEYQVLFSYRYTGPAGWALPQVETQCTLGSPPPVKEVHVSRSHGVVALVYDLSSTPANMTVNVVNTTSCALATPWPVVPPVREMASGALHQGADLLVYIAGVTPFTSQFLVSLNLATGQVLTVPVAPSPLMSFHGWTSIRADQGSAVERPVFYLLTTNSDGVRSLWKIDGKSLQMSLIRSDTSYFMDSPFFVASPSTGSGELLVWQGYNCLFGVWAENGTSAWTGPCLNNLDLTVSIAYDPRPE